MLNPVQFEGNAVFLAKNELLFIINRAIFIILFPGFSKTCLQNFDGIHDFVVKTLKSVDDIYDARKSIKLNERYLSTEP